MTWKATVEPFGPNELQVHLTNESRRPLAVHVTNSRVALERSPLGSDFNGAVTVRILGEKLFANPDESITLNVVTEHPLEEFPRNAELVITLFIPENGPVTVRHSMAGREEKPDRG